MIDNDTLVEIGKEYDLNDDELQDLIVATLCNKEETQKKKSID